MKKITLLLTLLLCVAGTAWAQIAAVSELNNTTGYTITSNGRGYLYWDADNFDGNYLVSPSRTTTVDASPDGSENQRFAFLRGTYTDEGKYYLYCIAANKFVGPEGNTVKLKLYDTPSAPITLTEDNGRFVLKFSDGKSINITYYQSFQGCKVFTANPDDGNRMAITSVATGLNLQSAVDAINTYENTAAQTEVQTAINNALPIIADLKKASYYSKPADAITTAENVVNSVQVSDVTPSNKAAVLEAISSVMNSLYASASENPLTNGVKIVLNNRLYPNNYAAANGSNNKMVRANEKNFSTVWQVEMKDAANGVFYLKNPYTGKYAGMYLGLYNQFGLADTKTWAGTFKIVNTPTQLGYVAFQAQQQADGNTVSDITDFTYANLHLDQYNQVVGWENGSTDKGTHFIVQAVSDEEIAGFENTAKTALQNALTAVNDAKTTYAIGTGIGEFTIKGDATVQAAQAVYDNVNSTPYQLDQATASITPAVTINQPTVGKLYRIKSVANSSGNNGNLYVSSTTKVHGPYNYTKMKLISSNDYTTVFQLCEGNKLLSFGRGNYVNETFNNSAVGIDNGNAFTFSQGTHVLSDKKGTYRIYGGGKWLVNNAEVADRQSGYDSNTCDWILEEVTWLPININAPYNVGTVYSPVPLNKKESRLKFYTGAVNGSELVLTQYTGDVIPANVPFLVVKQTEDPEVGCMFMEITNTAAELPAGTQNDLRGQAEAFAKGANSYYTLQPAWDAEDPNHNSASDVAFRLFTGTNLQGFRAYIPADAVTGESLSIRFEGEDDVTGIENTLTNANSKQEIFDLTGRRVSRATKGLYIINGQKVLVK